MKNFDQIRPYKDHEVPQVIERLLASDALFHAMAHVQFPRVSRYFEAPLTAYIRRRVARHMNAIHTVSEFQQAMMLFIDAVIKKSISEFTYDGIEHLKPGVPYVFVSNHRDITLDSALLNFVLLRSSLNTAEIAIGDNLLTNPLVSDLLRLNKSFIVNRSVTGLKAKLLALTELSHYISDSNTDGRSIWIAQREGRAKDGCDVTDPAIIKMLHLWPKKQGESFSDVIQRLNLVPVSISYEYDPCDGLKAEEMQARESNVYEKGATEDLESIMRGIALPKGRVHIQVGQPLQGEFASPIEVAHALDQQIVENYHLFPSSWLAVEQLLKLGKAVTWLQEETRTRLTEMVKQAKSTWDGLDAQELTKQTSEFSTRLSHYPVQVQRYILEMYANPLISKCQATLLPPAI